MKPSSTMERTRATIIPANPGFYLAQIDFSTPEHQRSAVAKDYTLAPVVAWLIEDSSCQVAITTSGPVRFTEWQNEGGPGWAVVGPDGGAWDPYHLEQYPTLKAWLSGYGLAARGANE